MRKFTVLDAALKLGISKEAIYNRIRRGTVKNSEEDGIRYVYLDLDDDTKKVQNSQISPKIAKNQDRFITYLLSQIDELKAKNELLLSDKDRLYKEKVDLLISTKDEIKSIYLERDEKLKFFLGLLSKPLLISDEKVENDAIDADFDVSEVAQDEVWISAGEYLTSINLTPKKLKKAKNILISNLGKSKFLKSQSGILYIRKGISIKHIKDENEQD